MNKTLYLWIGFVIVSLIVPLGSVIYGGIPFWYDPARDLTLAGDMFKKLSLLGQPSGIPGFFYPPYWLWAIMLILKIGRDPAVVSLLLLFIPYVIFFPLGLWLLKKDLSFPGIMTIWGTIIIAFNSYLSQIWNPNLAPLFLLWLIVSCQRRWFFAEGLLAGFLLAVHFGFGVPIIISLVLFHLLRKEIKELFPIGVGLFLTFTPTLVFELRNHFTQTKALLTAFASPVVGETGLTTREIILTFWNTWVKTVGANNHWLAGVLLAFMVLFLFFRYKNRLVSLLILMTGVTAFIFLRNHNPIWPYHFIGLETIFLLLITAVLSQLLERLSKIISPIIFLILVVWTINFWPVASNYLKFDGLAGRKAVVRYALSDMAVTQTDKGLCGFTVFGAVKWTRNFEYEYLINYISKSEKYPMPYINDNHSDCLYIIFPPGANITQQDNFLNDVSPVRSFTTTWVKNMPSGLSVVRRDRHEIVN